MTEISYAEKLRRMADEAGKDGGMKIYERIKNQCEQDASQGFKTTMISVPSIFTKFVLYRLHQDGLTTNVNACGDFNDTFIISWK